LVRQRKRRLDVAHYIAEPRGLPLAYVKAGRVGTVLVPVLSAETNASVLLVQTFMLATLASVTTRVPVASGAVTVAPSFAAYLLMLQAPWRALQLSPPCARLKGNLALPCIASVSGPLAAAAGLPALGAHTGAVMPRMSDEMDVTLGGFKNFDVMKGMHLSVGPRVSWLTPDSPREDLLRLRVVAPGWGVRYTWEEPAISVGVAACTRFVAFGEDWPVVDMLTSEARIELALP
jgi:hypothetical protein